MTYNFDEDVNRRNTYSLKWDVLDSELPMWVADMDFKAATEICEAMSQRIEHGVFGYNILPNEWYDAYINWWARRHDFTIEKDWLVFVTGVIPILSSCVRKLTTPGENVVIQTPVYNIFFNSILNNGRNVLESPLLYHDGKYDIDFVDLECKLANPQTTLMILCNPHNPIGKIWDKATLAKIGDLCVKHNVIVISDEIHCDLTAPNTEYVPFASVSDNCFNNSITCIAPTKTFNLAGIQTAAVVVPNKFLRHKVWRALNTDEVAEPNSFAVTAAIAAFNNGETWLDELRNYLQNNKLEVVSFLDDKLPKIKVVSLEATYLLWLDCSLITTDSEALATFIRKNTGLYLTAGSEYGKAGSQFLRLNVACTQKTLLDGLNRLLNGVNKFLV